MQTTLEAELAQVESAAQLATTTAGILVRQLKSARAAAVTGKLPELERAIAQAREQLAAVQEGLDTLERSWSFDARGYFEGGGYTRELLEEIERQGLAAAERDGRVLCYPSIVRVLPGELALEIDRKKERRVRPGFVAAELEARRGRKAGIRPEQMVEVLYKAYQPLVTSRKGSGVVRALEIFDLLTVLPHAREYSKQEFARDLLQLDMSEVRTTKSGSRLFLRADTSAKGSGVLAAVTPDGEVRIYSGVEFGE